MFKVIIKVMLRYYIYGKRDRNLLPPTGHILKVEAGRFNLLFNYYINLYTKVVYMNSKTVDYFAIVKYLL